MSNYILNKKTAGRCQSLSHEFATSGGYFLNTFLKQRRRNKKQVKQKPHAPCFVNLGVLGAGLRSGQQG